MIMDSTTPSTLIVDSTIPSTLIVDCFTPSKLLSELAMILRQRLTLQPRAPLDVSSKVHLEAPPCAHRFLLLRALLALTRLLFSANLLHQLLLVRRQLLPNRLLLLLAEPLAHHRHAALQEVALGIEGVSARGSVLGGFLPEGTLLLSTRHEGE